MEPKVLNVGAGGEYPGPVAHPAVRELILNNSNTQLTTVFNKKILLNGV